MVWKHEDAWMVLSGFLAPSSPRPWVCAKQTERGISPPGRASRILSHTPPRALGNNYSKGL